MNDAITVERLVTDNIKLPVYIVTKNFFTQLNHFEFDELVAVGNVGLVKAAKGFDASKGFKFSTYASLTICGEIKHFVRNSTDLITFARPSKELYKAICKKGLDKLEVTEIAKKMKVSVKKVKRAFEYSRLRYTSSLNEVVYDSGDGEPVTLGDCVKSYEDFESPVMYREIFELLDGHERIVFTGLYIESATQATIIKRLGRSWRVYEKVSQQVNEKLKRYFLESRLIS
ncbi:RNA polymerase primary sigma factor/RNA polymerase sporulation-specific sigma factor [Anaerospora hongkongensis]|uniref:RNA polymerase primary sigma factor/RNA polymerase sporulation-specific sigma factor n=1 Tax=Anaerospora hongkongensis TaxID=244830 RepID=A0A4R1Q2F2_9FIRM|nr:sigma factor [Anaerospora hongkongensis]TCL39997.1 RNA polymerase primary sigma factor/RNA polymerase sporulation-specific sigma factor [Anaerospora hongkongensis]